tara:strand:+ start:8 stop:520 length:513 start_codon:yes stop_codon:yes gene_type:complete
MLLMKKILSIIFLVLIFSGYAQANWEGSIKKNEFDEKTYKSILGPYITPGMPLDYPFEKLNFMPIMNCGSVVAFVFNNDVHLVDGRHLNSKTEEYNFRIKHGEQLENIKVEQELADPETLFVSSADTSRVFNWFKNEETIVLELKHYSDGVRYYKINTKGFKKVYNDTCL